jgi:hypothetical protein
MMRLASYVTAVFVISSAAVAQTSSPSAAVEKIEIEKAESGTFFRVSLVWPSEDMPASYAEFAQVKGFLRFTAAVWPHDSLALIPQSPGAYRVCREVPEGSDDSGPGFRPAFADATLPSPAVFVGRLNKPGKQDFLLRCPQSEGKWQYLPVSIDFGQANPGDGLAKQWLRSQAASLSGAYPDDNSFFPYARSRLLARLGVATTTQPTEPWMQRPEGSEQLYEITTGALAMQESLQLDRMRNADLDTGARDVPLDRIKGVAVRSHPWKEMIGARQPQIEPIAALVPEDQYYVRFTTTRALSDFFEFADAWGGSLLSVAETGGRDYGVKEKIENQICLKSSWLSKLLGPAVIEDLVLTGSDPYLREGSDLTIIFHLKAVPVFEAAVSRYLDDARKQHPDISEGKEDYEGASIQHLITPDQVVRCYRAKLDDYFLYSNSPAAIRRVIDTYKDKRASMAKSLDFSYIRTLYPLGDKEENGLIFLSDPFIRSLVGPGTRIAEKRRIEAITSLEIVKNAALLFLWENPGQKAPSLEQLYDKGYLDRKYLQTEPGDRISWDPATFTAGSERYGRTGYLTPIIEMPVEKVTAREEADYNRFRNRYQDYWRRYFDPIGMRITAGRDIALSVTILPLIDNSQYNQMKSFTGGKSVDLAPPSSASSAVVYAAAHLNPESPDIKSMQNLSLTMLPGAPHTAVEWIGERLRFWIEDSDALAAGMRDQDLAKVFQIPIVLGIETKNTLGLAAFLVAAQSMIRTSAPNMVVFEPTEPYRDYAFTRIRPASEGVLAADGSFANAAIYYGSVGNFLYISTSLKSLHNIVDAAPTTAPATSAAASNAPPVPATRPAVMGHFAVRLGLGDAKNAKDVAEFYLGQSAQLAEAAHRQNLLLLAQTVGLGEKAAATPQRVLGYSIKSALGNTYHYDAAHDDVVGSVTGPQWAAAQPQTIPDDSPLGRLVSSIRSLSAHLSFTEDGLRSDLQIEGK